MTTTMRQSCSSLLQIIDANDDTLGNISVPLIKLIITKYCNIKVTYYESKSWHHSREDRVRSLLTKTIILKNQQFYIMNNRSAFYKPHSSVTNYLFALVILQFLRNYSKLNMLYNILVTQYHGTIKRMFDPVCKFSII